MGEDFIWIFNFEAIQEHELYFVIERLSEQCARLFSVTLVPSFLDERLVGMSRGIRQSPPDFVVAPTIVTVSCACQP